jgi:hypothetical protein
MSLGGTEYVFRFTTMVVSSQTLMRHPSNSANAPNNVRVQLARIYRKLEIKDKSLLASALGKRSTGSF